MKYLLILMILFSATSWANTKDNNNFYDDAEKFSMEGLLDIKIDGLVKESFKIDISKLALRQVTVKESYLKNNKPVFKGAYVYEGYSLFDILKDVNIDKERKGKFGPVIDLLVLVENNKGDKAVISWGEIFYASRLHEIIIANKVSPVLPSFSNSKWPISKHTKLICSNDLISIRNIDEPTKLTIFTTPVNYQINKGMKPMYSDSFDLFNKNKKLENISMLDKFTSKVSYEAVIFGHGKGYLGVENLNGVLLKDLLANYFTRSKKNLGTGFFIVVGKDGYRAAISPDFDRFIMRTRSNLLKFMA